MQIIFLQLLFQVDFYIPISVKLTVRYGAGLDQFMEAIGINGY